MRRPVRWVVRALRSALLRGGRVVTRSRHRLPPALDRAIETLKWCGRAPDVPPPASPAGRPAVVIGPANFAGQGWRWARALEEHAGVAAQSWVYVTDPSFAFPDDYRVPVGIYRASAGRQRERYAALVDRVDGVVIEAGRPLFGRLFGYDPVREAEALARDGVAAALLWHGTDIRVPSAHAREHGRSPFRDTEMSARTAALESVALRNRRRRARFDGPTLVSTPDLLLSLPDAQWCPVVVDVGTWRGAPPALERDVPVVCHVPSNPWLKGTALVEPALRALDAEGVISYRPAVGRTSEQVLELYRDADIVLDQFRLGIYGVAACEAMAAGRVVVSSVDPAVRDVVRRRTGLELPVVEASPDDLAATLRRILAERDEYRRSARAGVDFVAEVHDGRRAARALQGALRLLV